MSREAAPSPRPVPDGRCVAEAMLCDPKVFSPQTTVAQARAFFGDEHVHAALIVEDGRLLAVVEPLDLVGDLPAGSPAASVGRLRGRVTAPDADLAATWEAMTVMGRRRLAVVGSDGDLLGLLCLKRSGLGFCSDADVQARAADCQHSVDPCSSARWR